MATKDIRWQQRFSNYKKALNKLSSAVKTVEDQLDYMNDTENLDDDDELLLEGLIQRFEYTQELAWNVMKDYAIYQGYSDIAGSRDAIRKAFAMEIIDDKSWMNTIEDRNRTSHLYNQAIVHEIIDTIIEVYHPLFCAFEQKMSEIIVNSPPQST